MIVPLLSIIDDAPHPTIPADASWAGVLIILILGLIVAATAVGIVVRINHAHRDEAE